MYPFELQSITINTMGWDSKRFTRQDSVVDGLKCSICLDILEEPVQAPCEHTFCKTCIQNWLDQGKRSCPVDRQELSSDSFKPPTRMTQQLLDKLTVRCINYVDGCHLQCALEYMHQLIQHEEKWCQAVDNGDNREIHDLKNKIVELQDALSLMENTINAKDQMIREHEETISHLQRSNNEEKITMETCAFSPSAPPLEMLESTSSTPMCSEPINQDSPQGKNRKNLLKTY